MLPFLKKNKAALTVAALDMVLFAAFQILKGRISLANFWTERLTTPFKLLLARLFAPLPITAMELCYAALVLWLLFWLGKTVYLLIQAPSGRLRCLLRRLMQPVLTAATVAVCFSLLWGINYYADGFQEKAGTHARGVAVTELYDAARYFRVGLNAASAEVPRNEDGTLAADAREILARSEDLYLPLLADYPFLSNDLVQPQPMVFSRICSYLGFTGVTFPFTGEACINVDVPVSSIPCTVAHELAHQQGFASEQECNFLGILACLESSDPLYRYSGWLSGYVHLSNALYKADRELWKQLREETDPNALADLALRSAYWQQFEGPVDTAASKAYDSMLKGYGDSSGIQSYGTVTDLLVVYHQLYWK